MSPAASAAIDALLGAAESSKAPSRVLVRAGLLYDEMDDFPPVPADLPAYLTPDGLNETYVLLDGADVEYVTPETAEATFETVGAGSDFTAAFLAKLTYGQADAVLTVVGDSTGAGDTSTDKRWVTLLAEHLAASYPAYTVTIRFWNNTTVAYDAPVTIQTGTGPRTLAVYNGSASGKDSNYALANFAAQVPVRPDVILFSHGHNNSAAFPANYIPNMRDLIGQAVTTYPGASVIVSTQNPETTADNPTRLGWASSLVALAGSDTYGLIDAGSAFLADPDWETNLMGDTIHPNAAGYDTWAREAIRVFTRNLSIPPRAPRPGNRLWLPAERFLPAEGTPVTAWVTNKGLVGWQMDAATIESVVAVVDIPRDWQTFNAYLYWTVSTNPGATNGNAMWRLDTATFAHGAIAPALTAGVVRNNNLAGPTDGSKVIREDWLTTSASPYQGSGYHSVKVMRFGSNAGDTLGMDAMFLGLLFEQVS